MDQYLTFLESLKDYMNMEIVECAINGYRKIVIEGVDDVNEMNEYFKGLPGPKVSREVTLLSQKGAGRQAYRMTPGRGRVQDQPKGDLKIGFIDPH